MGSAAACIPSLMYCCDPRVINHTTGGVGGRGGGTSAHARFRTRLRFRFREVRPIISGWK